MVPSDRSWTARWLLVAVLPIHVACDSSNASAPTAPKARSQAVVTTAQMQPEPAPNAGPSGTSAEGASPTPARILCQGQLDKPGRAFATEGLNRASDEGTPLPPEQLKFGGGQWTWVNFWAAWCVPCKEEIPRLRSWEKKLAASGKPFHLSFVSLDDDARQLNDFLESQPADGIKQTYWLKDGEPRERWLEAAGIDPDPELPAHLLVDRVGKVRCVLNGAVEDSDFERAEKILGG